MAVRAPTHAATASWVTEYLRLRACVLIRLSPNTAHCTPRIYIAHARNYVIFKRLSGTYNTTRCTPKVCVGVIYTLTYCFGAAATRQILLSLTLTLVVRSESTNGSFYECKLIICTRNITE